MIEHGYTKGLSLTHLQLNAEDRLSIIPLEVSLCSEPARPFCYVYYYNLDQIRTQAYKRNILSSVIPDPASKSIMTTQDKNQMIVEETPKPLIEQVTLVDTFCILRTSFTQPHSVLRHCVLL